MVSQTRQQELCKTNGVRKQQYFRTRKRGVQSTEVVRKCELRSSNVVGLLEEEVNTAQGSLAQLQHLEQQGKLVRRGCGSPRLLA